jgi:predicted HTH transcriptional regulator
MERLTDRQLLELLDDLESDRVERKESCKNDMSKRARQAVCAFANDLPGHEQPGILFIGARDDGEASGLENASGFASGRDGAWPMNRMSAVSLKNGVTRIYPSMHTPL